MLATLINEAVFKELLEGAPTSAKKTRLLSGPASRASERRPGYLSHAVRPVGLGLWLTPGDFRAAVLLRPGLPLGPYGVRCAFLGCGELLDKEGHNTLTCKPEHSGDVRQRRHNAVAR